jgi:hypothetical protein
VTEGALDGVLEVVLVPTAEALIGVVVFAPDMRIRPVFQANPLTDVV